MTPLWWKLPLLSDGSLISPQDSDMLVEALRVRRLRCGCPRCRERARSWEAPCLWKGELILPPGPPDTS